MLTRYWSLSQPGHLQPHSKLKAWQLYTTVKWPIVPMSFQTTTTCVMVEKGSTVSILLAFQMSTFHM